MAKYPRSLVTATSAHNIPFVREANNPDAPVVSLVALDRTIDANFRRQSTFQAFLPAALAHTRRENLNICVQSVVSSIDFEKKDDGTLRAEGVFIEHEDMKQDSRRFYAKARQEIVLCGGVFGSPQTLMLRYVYSFSDDKSLLKCSQWDRSCRSST